MPTTTKNIVRAKRWIDPAFDARIAQESDVSLSIFPLHGDDDAAWAMLEPAHVYQVPVAKDELPQQFFVRAPLIARCPQLLCASANGAGYDTIDVAACTAAGILVVNQAGGNAVSVAEHTIGLLLGVAHKMLECDRRMRRETGFAREAVMGREIRGKTIGLVGIGHTGTRVATFARAFEMNVIAFDPLLSAAEIETRGARSVSFDELLRNADVVSLHCPRDASTLKLMNADAFARMKPGAIFISTARGGIHDETALAQALQSKHLAGAGLDVWDKEPPPLDHPLLQMDNVFATFHTAGVTHEARRNMAFIGAEQIAQILAGKRPPRIINPEAWDVFCARRNEILGV
jgi:D-3-phosphoglycerate dehydrogenase / 2-oxoglutarate reductase